MPVLNAVELFIAELIRLMYMGLIPIRNAYKLLGITFLFRGLVSPVTDLGRFISVGCV